MTVVQLLTYNDTEEQEKYISELETMTKKLQDREAEVIDLQKKIINLFEELRRTKVIA
jgi:hypothetical protein